MLYPAFLVILLVAGNNWEDGDEREDTPNRSSRKQPLLLKLWWYRYVFPNTHNTHAHAQFYVHATLILRVSTLSIPAACLLLHRNRITH